MPAPRVTSVVSSPQVMRRVAVVVLVALAFGLVAGVFKGNGAPGWRSSIGNLSAPWLLVALIPAWWAGSVPRCAIIGTLATLSCLAGFYVGVTAQLYGQLGGASGLVGSFVYVVEANRIWFVAGLLSGPTCGAVAGALGRRLSVGWLVAIGAILMVLEVGAVRLVAGVRLPVLNVAWGVTDWRGYELQAAAGTLTLALVVVSALVRLRRSRT